MNSFQKYLQKEASSKQNKQSQNFKTGDFRREDYEEQPVESPSKNRSGSRQTFGDKVQRFNKPIVPNDQDDARFDKTIDKHHPVNFGYEQTVPQIPQNVYQSQAIIGNNAPQSRYGPQDQFYGNQNHQTEKELAGYSEQIMSTAGMPQYMGGNQGYFGNTMGANSLEFMKSYNMDPKSNMYGPNMMSMNMPPNMMMGNQYAHPQPPMYGANTFGGDPNMSMYGAPRQNEYQPPSQMVSKYQKYIFIDA